MATKYPKHNYIDGYEVTGAEYAVYCKIKENPNISAIKLGELLDLTPVYISVCCSSLECLGLIEFTSVNRGKNRKSKYLYKVAKVEKVIRWSN